MTRTPPVPGEASERLRLRLLDVIDQLRRAERHLAASDTDRASSAIEIALGVAQAAFDELLPEPQRPELAVRPDDSVLEVVQAAQEDLLKAPDCTVEERFVGVDGRVVTFVRQSGATYGIVSTVIGGRVARDERFDTWRAALHAAGGAAPRRSSS